MRARLLAKLPNKRCLRYATHGLHEYRGKFFPQLVRALMNIVKLPKSGVVLDPSSGMTLVEARLSGRTTYGPAVSRQSRYCGSADRRRGSTPAPGPPATTVDGTGPRRDSRTAAGVSARCATTCGSGARTELAAGETIARFLAKRRETRTVAASIAEPGAGVGRHAAGGRPTGRGRAAVTGGQGRRGDHLAGHRPALSRDRSSSISACCRASIIELIGNREVTTGTRAEGVLRGEQVAAPRSVRGVIQRMTD